MSPRAAAQLWYHGLGPVPRLCIQAAAFGVIAFMVHCVVYAAPKAIDRAAPDVMPLQYEFWDRRNFWVSMVASSLLGLGCTFLLHRLARVTPGRCVHCHYDLRGLEDDTRGCPECGEPIHTTS